MDESQQRDLAVGTEPNAQFGEAYADARLAVEVDSADQ
jgi:hypothetical protein